MQALRRYRARQELQCLARGYLDRKAFGKLRRATMPRSDLKTSSSKPSRNPRLISRLKQLGKSFKESAVICIQKHIRGFIARRRYAGLLLDKMFKDQEEMYESERLKIAQALSSDPNVWKISTPDITDISYTDQSFDDSIVPTFADLTKLKRFDMPLPVSQRSHLLSFSPAKNRKLIQPTLFEFDIFILAAVEIQRIWRGYAVRKDTVGRSFQSLRRKVVKIQRIYREWRKRRRGQIELAITLMKKHTNMMVSSYRSYQHLKSLVLVQDKTGRFSGVIDKMDKSLKDVGLISDQSHLKQLEAKVRRLHEQKKSDKVRLKDEARKWKYGYKDALGQCLIGMKTLRSQMECTYKTQLESLTAMVKELVRAKHEVEDAESIESSFEFSTQLPECSIYDIY